MKTLNEDENLSYYLANSLAIVIQGNNDYINNYLMPEFYGASFVYNPNMFADILIENYKRHILVIYFVTYFLVENLISESPFSF
jgi:hypothetical protein